MNIVQQHTIRDATGNAFDVAKWLTEPEPIPTIPAATKAKPFVKWVGGKGSLVGHITSKMPGQFRHYWEPFVGGGAVFWSLAGEGRMQGAYLSDYNEELVNTYQVLTECQLLPDLISVLKMLPYDPNVFANVRSRQPDQLCRLMRAARMIYLNKTCFNGLYRVNSRGVFNAPFGRYTNPAICDEANLKACHAVLSAFREKNLLGISTADYSIALKAEPGDVVYFDPPYWPVSKTANFTGYTKGGFGPTEQTALRDVFSQLAKKGVTVVASNSDCPETRDLYRDFPVHSIQARRNLNTKGDGRGPVGEIVVTGGPSV